MALTSDGWARTDLDPVQLRSAAVPHSRAGEITTLHVWTSADASVGVVDRTAADQVRAGGSSGSLWMSTVNGSAGWVR